jgi:NarL family two-component system response regulator LiaR
MSETIRVLIVDDHAIVRKGIAALLATEPDVAVVGEAKDGSEAVAEAQRLLPDVILMDLVMPVVDGLTAIRQIVANQPNACILVLTSFANDERIFSAIKAGALGYLLKDSGPKELVEAIHQVHRGQSSLHPVVARKLLQELSDPPPLHPASPPLTEREMGVLELVAQGLTNRQIADILHIKEATVRTHVSNILNKLQLDSRTQAALYALREGLASIDDSEPDLRLLS